MTSPSSLWVFPQVEKLPVPVMIELFCIDMPGKSLSFVIDGEDSDSSGLTLARIL